MTSAYKTKYWFSHLIKDIGQCQAVAQRPGATDNDVEGLAAYVGYELSNWTLSVLYASENHARGQE